MEKYILSTGLELSREELFEAMRIADKECYREDVEGYIEWNDISVPVDKREEFLKEVTNLYIDCRDNDVCDCWTYDLDYALSQTLEKFNS